MPYPTTHIDVADLVASDAKQASLRFHLETVEPVWFDLALKYATSWPGIHLAPQQAVRPEDL